MGRKHWAELPAGAGVLSTAGITDLIRWCAGECMEDADGKPSSKLVRHGVLHILCGRLSRCSWYGRHGHPRAEVLLPILPWQRKKPVKKRVL